jgi:hypothetical protein
LGTEIRDNELIKVEYKLSLNFSTSAKKVKRINFFSGKSAIHDGVASERNEVNLIRDGRLLVNKKEISDTINHHSSTTGSRLTSNLINHRGCTVSTRVVVVVYNRRGGGNSDCRGS